MCSINTDGIVDMERAATTLDISRKDVMCRKCPNGVAEVVLRVKDAYCRSCFLEYFIHKFRSTIGKSKQIQPGDRVLVCLSGGASSTALLHLIKDGLLENSHKKLRFEPTFLYVDECVVSAGVGGGGGEGCDRGHHIVEQAAALGLPCYVAALEQVMSGEPHLPRLPAQQGEDDGHPPDENLGSKLVQLLASCSSASAQQDLLDQLLHTLLRRCAHSMGFKKMFLGDNSTTLAVRILSQVALGRGSQLSTRVHFKSVWQSVQVFRPMRELLETEIMQYLNIQGIKVSQPQTFQPKSPSIVSCTDNFVRGLQKEFPATIPTIFRTGDKLVAGKVEGDKERHCKGEPRPSAEECCALCALVLDTEKGEASALHATVVSHKYSSKKSEVLQQKKEKMKHDSSQGCCKEKLDNDICSGEGGGERCVRPTPAGNGTKTNVDILTQPESMEEYLCYGCRLILKDLSDQELLPCVVKATVAEHRRRVAMREHIQDFLL